MYSVIYSKNIMRLITTFQRMNLFGCTKNNNFIYERSLAPVRALISLVLTTFDLNKRILFALSNDPKMIIASI